MEFDLIQFINDHGGSELGFVVLIVFLFIVPRILLRIGIPMALTAFGLGVATSFGFNFLDGDNVIPTFSTLGIISLFLFAGLEVDLDALKNSYKPLLGHVGIGTVVLIILAIIVTKLYDLPVGPAVVFALALATPSTGFILNNLETSNIPVEQKYWIKLKAISAELVALALLLIFSQTGGIDKTLGSFIIIIAMILVLPFLLKKLSVRLEKLSPGSEFGFILILALISSVITKKLGAYYIVGAFIVGMATGQYKRKYPSVTTDQIFQSLRSFSAFFLPFYFFNSGIKMPIGIFSLESLEIALLLLAITLPIKIGTIVLSRRFSFVEEWKDSFSVAVSLTPTLIFGLVLAEILKTKMGLSTTLYVGLIIYTLLTTIFSQLILKIVPVKKELGIFSESMEP